MEAVANTSPICLGDLFDTSTNDEAVIEEAWQIIGNCTMVLAGNHDLANHVGELSSLELSRIVYWDGKIICDPQTDSFHSRYFPVENVLVVMVPHKLTQELFEQALDNAMKGLVDYQHPRVICLHCNYNSGFINNDSTLHLTRDKAADLLKVFDYVLIGHEHIPRADFDGRLQILGNTYPTSFADISDKYVWHWAEGKLTKSLLWDSGAYVNAAWEWLLKPTLQSGPTAYSTTPNWAGVEFIEVTGTAPAERMPEIARAIQRLWKEAPDAVMIRNNVQVQEAVAEEATFDRLLDMPARVRAGLKDPEMQALWTEYVEKVTS